MDRDLERRRKSQVPNHSFSSSQVLSSLAGETLLKRVESLRMLDLSCNSLKAYKSVQILTRSFPKCPLPSLVLGVRMRN